MAQWACAADDDCTKLVGILLNNTALALNLMRDVELARQSGSAKRVAKVRRRLDRVLAAIAAG